VAYGGPARAGEWTASPEPSRCRGHFILLRHSLNRALRGLKRQSKAVDLGFLTLRSAAAMASPALPTPLRLLPRPRYVLRWYSLSLLPSVRLATAAATAARLSFPPVRGGERWWCRRIATAVKDHRGTAVTRRWWWFSDSRPLSGEVRLDPSFPFVHFSDLHVPNYCFVGLIRVRLMFGWLILVVVAAVVTILRQVGHHSGWWWWRWVRGCTRIIRGSVWDGFG
jgi:hypothetical protein